METSNKTNSRPKDKRMHPLRASASSVHADLPQAYELAICLTSGVRDEAREAVRSDWTWRDGESSRPPLTAFDKPTKLY